MNKLMRINYFIKKTFLFVGIFLFLNSCGVRKSLHDLPDVSKYEKPIAKRKKINDSTYVLGSDFLTKNKQGQWELLVNGNPYQLGLKTGILTKELFNYQEEIFINKIDDLVPSEGKQNFLRKFLAWFNRKMYLNIDEKFKAEIYGISKNAKQDLDYIAKPYQRVMYFHGAHDIGHALQDLALVGCSSFASWGEHTEDGKMIIGRNFDFYVGDEFAKNKIIAFVKPDDGYNFMSVTWGGFIGVLSGMNDQGLTVTINAGKSDFPLVAKTPISLVTREILQYASTIEEAIAIAKTRKVFVSESIFIGSAKDKKAAIIEVSPKNFGVYEVENTNQLICSNHFQSAAYVNDKKNKKHILESHSQYRFERMEELLDEQPKITPEIAVDILRDKKGLNEKAIGYGNEKALNQLIAHHGIVFKPEDLLVWVSSNPYQLGEFVAYDLKDIFSYDKQIKTNTSLSNSNLNIKADSFLQSDAYANYKRYRELYTIVKKAIADELHLENSILQEFEASNSEFWEVHYLIGLYKYNKGYDTVALEAFLKAGTKEITTVPDKEQVERYIHKLNRRLN